MPPQTLSMPWYVSLLTGAITALAIMTLVMSVISSLIVVVLICTPLRGKYYACIWSTIALATGLLGAGLAHFILLPTTSTWSGIIFGSLGLSLWFNARNPKPRVEPATYDGPRCVACRQPIETGTNLCPACGWTQPARQSGT
jgi:hypothetical protein